AVWSEATGNFEKEVSRRGPRAAEPRVAGAEGGRPEEKILAVWRGATGNFEKEVSRRDPGAGEPRVAGGEGGRPEEKILSSLGRSDRPCRQRKGEADLRAEPAATGAGESLPKEGHSSGLERSDRKIGGAGRNRTDA